MDVCHKASSPLPLYPSAVLSCPTAVMDETTATGMAPEDVADIVLEAVVNKRTDLVVASFVPRLVLLVRALLPWLYFAIMKGRAKRLRLQQRRVQ